MPSAATSSTRRRPTPRSSSRCTPALPTGFVDHTHADAILALTNQPDGAASAPRSFGARAVVVPYAMSDFALAKAVSAAVEAAPEAEGAVLLKHGVLTFAETAEESYRRMIGLVSLAEARLRKARRRTVFAAAGLPRRIAAAADVAPVLRGLTSAAPEAGGRFVLAFRTSRRIRTFVGGAALGRYSQRGLATPDHVIRIKPRPLVVPAPEAGRLGAFATTAAVAVAAYGWAYGRYFARHNRHHGGARPHASGGIAHGRLFLERRSQ